MATAEHRRGGLVVFLGAAPGVGKTTAMLVEGARLADAGSDVVVGLIETHGRASTEARLEGFDQMPRRRISYRDAWFEELDVDAILRRHPGVALVDELAHTNVPGSRHEKRWQDVEELLGSGIDVVTNLNVAHLDSLNEAIEEITGVAPRETVPDQVVTAASSVDLVDATSQELQARLSKGDVYAVDDAATAARGYYRAETVSALRELAHTWLSGHGLGSLPTEPARPPAPVIAALTGGPEGQHVVRRSAAIATSEGRELIGVHVREPSGLVESRPVWLGEQRRLLAELNGRYVEVAGIDVAGALLDLCRVEHAQHLVLGASRRTRRDAALHGSIIGRLIRNAGPVELHLIPSRQAPTGLERATNWPLTGRGRILLPRRRRQVAWALAVAAPVVLSLALLPLRSSVGVAGALFAALLGVVAVAAIGGIRPAGLAIVAGFLSADFFFTVPYYSLRVDQLIDVIALIAFAVVAGVVGVLVDILTRQGIQTAGARTEADALARMAADSVRTTPESLPRFANAVRETFGLDAVAVLVRTPDGWEPEFVVGEPVPTTPEQTPFTADLADGRVLALLANPDAEPDSLQLLKSFVSTLRHRREIDQLATLATAKPTGYTTPR